MEPSIFNMFDEPAVAEEKKQKGVDEKVTDLAVSFHTNRKEISNEPDWNEQLLKAKNSTEKMHVRAAREAWLNEQKVKAWEAQQAVFNSKVDQILSKPIHERTKSYWDQLRKESPSQYYDSRAQKQRQKDQQVLGLGFHLKG